MQSGIAAGLGGLGGGAVAIAAGLDLAGAALLAGALGGATDVGIHLLQGDVQFRAAVTNARERLRQVVSGAP